MSACVLHLDKLQYYPGDDVVGKVICRTSETQNIKWAQVDLKGTEHTGWVGPEIETLDIVEYSGDNTFLELHTKKKFEEGDLLHDNLEYPFQFKLPRTLPGSYVGKYGCIRYTILAEVVGTVNTNVDKKEVKIVAPIDFSETRGLQLRPVSYSEEREVTSWCCFRGPIVMTVSLEKEAFVLGETAKVRVKVTNKSFDEIFRIEAKIWMTIETKVTTPRRLSKFVLAWSTVDHTDQIDNIEGKIYEFNLNLPKSTKLPNFAQCKLFRQSCKLEVLGVLKGLCSNVKIGTYVVVGHIPIGGHRQPSDQFPVEDTGHPFSLPRCNSIGFAMPSAARSSSESLYQPSESFLDKLRLLYVSHSSSHEPSSAPPCYSSHGLAEATALIDPSSSSDTQRPVSQPGSCVIGFNMSAPPTASQPGRHHPVPILQPVNQFPPSAPSLDLSHQGPAEVGTTTAVIESRTDLTPPPSYEQVMSSTTINQPKGN